MSLLARLRAFGISKALDYLERDRTQPSQADGLVG